MSEKGSSIQNWNSNSSTWLAVQEHRIPIRGILFDKDGTLLDFLSTWGLWITEMTTYLTNRYPDLTKDWILPGDVWRIGASLSPSGRVISYRSEGPLAMASTHDLIVLIAHQLYSTGLPWDVAISSAWDAKYEADALLHRVHHVKPMSGIEEFLSTCTAANLLLGVVTADDTESALQHLQDLGIAPHFQVVIGSDQVQFGKPHPQMALMACERLGLSPHEVVLVGDTSGDIQMARRAGLAMAIGISKESISGADVTISRYQELTIQEISLGT